MNPSGPSKQGRMGSSGLRGPPSRRGCGLGRGDTRAPAAGRRENAPVFHGVKSWGRYAGCRRAPVRNQNILSNLPASSLPVQIQSVEDVTKDDVFDLGSVHVSLG